MNVPPNIENTAINKDTQLDNKPDIQPIAFRIAAGLLFANICVTGLSLLVGDVPNVVPVIIDVLLIIGLLRLNMGARGFALFRTWAGAIVVPIFAFIQNDPFSAAILTLIQVCYCGALILLLQGATRPWKIWVALAMGALALGISTLLLLLVIASMAMSSLLVAIASL
jgi:hypothetical protein